MNKKKLFSNLMGTGMRLTILSAILVTALIGTVIPAAALGPIDLNSYTLSSYGGTQDSACTGLDTAISPDGLTLQITGNCWKQIDLGYSVTANTVLEFDFQSTQEGEIHGIGFDTNDTINNPIQIFQVYGTQAWGLPADAYTGAGSPQHYVIPVGQFLAPGNYTSMTFANDSDAGPIGDSSFSNINIYEGTPPPASMLTVNTNGTLVSAPFESYGGAVQDVSSVTTIEDGGLTLHIVGNGWKKVAIPYTVTADTVLDFDFSSNDIGEIHAIGFDTNDTINDPILSFQISGSQGWGEPVTPTYVAGSGIVHYSIPVGTFITPGSFLYLTFTNDDDVANPTAESVFSNITLTDPNPACTAPCFDLYAVAGETSLPGLADPVTVWGYNTVDAPVDKPGGPMLVVNQNDEVSITLHNTLGEQTSLLFQGQSMIPDLTGIGSGGSTTYTFTASKPGTFLYEAGLLPNAQHQVAMGLYGALIVRPVDGSGTPISGQAYASAATAFNGDRVMVLSELDTALNNSADPASFDMRDYNPKYYLINGKAYPDTDIIPVSAGNKILLRYVNAGLQAHSMSTLGVSQSIIANDGNAYLYPHSVVAESIPTGQTMDTLISVPASAASGTQYPLYDASLFLRNNIGSGSFAGLGGMLTMITVGTPPSGMDTTGPTASGLDATSAASDGTAPITISATISDAATGNSNVLAAEFYIDNTAGIPVAMTGTFGSPTVAVTGDVPADTLEPGTHTFYVRGVDSADNTGSFATVTFEITAVNVVSDSLHFSTSGQTASGPSGVGTQFDDIYAWDSTASAFSSPALDVLDGANVDGFSPVSDTAFYVSFAGDTDVTGVGTVHDADVVYFDGTNWSLYFDGTANGLGSVDAISVVGGELYFSTGDTSLPTGVTGPGDDADIYYWDGATTFARVFDATALGWSGNNVDGLFWSDSSDFYLSYSPTSTPVAGLGIVQDEDVVHYKDGVWSIYFDGTSKGLTSFSLDVDAFNAP